MLREFAAKPLITELRLEIMGSEELRTLPPIVQTRPLIRTNENQQNNRRGSGLVGWNSRAHGAAGAPTC